MLYGEKPVRRPQSSARLRAMEPSTALSGLFAPSISEDTGSESYPSTPPAQLLSPQPRTPRPTRFLSPPRTPLPKLFTNFPTEIGQLQETSPNERQVESITRPGSVCSSYSSSSDSSFDSLSTFNTTGGSCTSPETESSFFPDELATKEGRDIVSGKLSTSNTRKEGGATGLQKKLNVKSRTRKVQWTEDMDGHLWRTYVMCQQDPKITPFFVLPGQVPPLGVCHKVAREAKRSWKEAKMGDGWRSPLNTARSRQKRFVTPAKEVGVSGNRGDVLRKTSPYSWPASEASTRRRLRELCRRSYGPSRNPHHGYHQQRRPASTTTRALPSRSSTVSPSPHRPASSDRLNSRDAFLFSTRSIALSLTTSTASTMKPSGILAAIAAGYDIDAGMAVGMGGSSIGFDGIPGQISGVDSSDHGDLGVSSLVGEGSGLRSEDSGFSVAQDNMARARVGVLGASSTTTSALMHGRPVLLPPLELKSSSSAYGTWPRRQKRQEELESGDESIILPPPRRARRGTIGDLFGEPIPVPAVPRTRTRGFTIGSTSGNSISRRRFRQLAPLLTVTGPVSYDSPNDGESLSPLASRETMSDSFRDPSEAPKHLGLAFMEPKDWERNKFEGSDELSFGVCGDKFLQRGCGDDLENATSIRPVKRARE